MTVRVRINAIRYIFFEADVRTFELESLLDVSVTRIGDTFSTVFHRLNAFTAKNFRCNQINAFRFHLDRIHSSTSEPKLDHIHK